MSPATRKKNPAVYDENNMNEILLKHDCQIMEEPTKDYELFVKGLGRCAEFSSAPQARRPARIYMITKQLLKKRGKHKPDATATRLTWLITTVSYGKALQEDIHWCRQQKLLEAAQKGTSPKKGCRHLLL